MPTACRRPTTSRRGSSISPKPAARARARSCACRADAPMTGRTVTLKAALEEGLRHHNAGGLADARRVFQDILKTAPRVAIALHQLGMIEHLEGNLPQAI